MTQPLDFIRSPLGIALLVLFAGFSGSEVDRRMGVEARDSVSVSRIDGIERRLDEIRQDQRDLRWQIDDIARTLRGDDRPLSPRR